MFKWFAQIINFFRRTEVGQVAETVAKIKYPAESAVADAVLDAMENENASD